MASALVTNKEKNSTKYYLSVKTMFHEASGQMVSVNEPQKIENYSGVVSIEQASLPFKNT